ncbi:hypothetical protein [Christiangramia sp. LLG6405-1]|uniref:hypothetical protein n=1 Tax=Christiangramia sp. LLG6405-1 TaxID=3160832 RepID=UPI00386F9478
MKEVIDYIMSMMIIGILLLNTSAFSQTYIDKESPLVVEDQTLTQSVLEDFGIFSIQNSRNGELTNNDVFLKQIGDINEANIRTQTQFSEINLTQLGDGNNADIYYNVNTAVADIIQQGHYNIVRDYVNQPSADISLDLQQDGSFMQFERHGVNELTKSIRFEQNSNATPYIIIRSYK